MITEEKYLWTIEEDFPLFLKSIFACSNRLLQEIEAKLEKSVREEERLKVQAELTYLLAQQFIDAPEILGHFSETKRKNNTEQEENAGQEKDAEQNRKAETAGQVSENWEQLKLKEKDGNKSVLSGVPAALPSLIKAYRIQDKARNVGFDWEEREQVWDKVKEEIGEFQDEVANMDKDKAEAEFGDVMFSLINAARLYKINPDNALELTNQKFIRRFNYLEEHTIKEGKNLKDMSLEEMDAIWNEAKKKGL